ncbi:MAG TPA: PucR family transcriptional regulator [Candidatus Gemmiger avium]|nr:PucR family transcriptional regulator [Candidatus Gemmiger avium]
MSLTVAQLVELPCLRRAKVLAGHSGLDRIVNSITVLEYANPTPMQKTLFESIDFWGGELILTGFCNVADDVEAQCANIRMFAAAGEVGMVLYYVGLILPRVDPRLIQLADELGFVLICMPENEPNLRYSEVIHEAMDAIVRDELNNPTFTIDLLEQMTKVPPGQQSVKTILRIASGRLRASAVVTDSEYHLLSEASWPLNQDMPWASIIQQSAAQMRGDCTWEIKGERSLWAYKAEIHPSGCGRMYLFVFSEHGKLDPLLWKQAVEGVQLSIGVWGRAHDQKDLSELVRAIILDEPIKMRRLGELYHIDVASLSDMWILRSLRGENLSPWVDEVAELSSLYTRIGLCEHYENDILIFPVGSRTLREMDEWTDSLVQFCTEKQLCAKVTRCTLLQYTANAKYAYDTNRAYLEDSIKVFPRRACFTISEIEFVKECRELAAGGEEHMRRYLSLLGPILEGKDGQEIVDTLSAYLLDENSSVTQTAEHLFVHKNTVKYRLQKADNLLGFRVGDIPQSKNLLYALALRRILQRQPD